MLYKKLYSLAKSVAPSIFLFTEANDYDAKTYKELEIQFRPLLKNQSQTSKTRVRLLDHTPDGDLRLTAALMHTSSTLSYKECLRKAGSLKNEERKGLCLTAFRYMEFYDAALREFEYLDLTFELVVSATCFAQLKRHRMATLTSQPYDPGLGVTIPPSIKEVGSEGEFEELIERTDATYRTLKRTLDVGAEYILTNSHRRRVLLKANARELYHISRLREDATAQWDIRDVAQKMTELAKEAMPLTFLLIGAKDRYPEIYKKIFGRPPKAIPPKLL
jgi:thymidylate synthase ThyX